MCNVHTTIFIAVNKKKTPFKLRVLLKIRGHCGQVIGMYVSVRKVTGSTQRNFFFEWDVNQFGNYARCCYQKKKPSSSLQHGKETSSGSAFRSLGSTALKKSNIFRVLLTVDRTPRCSIKTYIAPPNVHVILYKRDRIIITDK